jgi:hypothetical protein
MCYGICHFENSMGNCTIRWSKKTTKDFINEFGFTPCFIGGRFECQEVEDEYNEIPSEERIKLRKIIYEKYGR